MLLRQVKQLLEGVPHRMSVTVVNPLQLLRELFTVNGAGTLIRRGSRIDVARRLGAASTSAAHGAVRIGVRTPLRPSSSISRSARVFVEDELPGRRAHAARRRSAPYLTKFAVERQAQGEGIGGELWSLVTRDFPRFFWRRAPDNAITAWYAKQCDGLVRFPEWHVFWRGLPIETIDPAMRFALAAPNDFAS